MRIGLGFSNRYGVSPNWCMVFANIARLVRHELILAHDTHFALDVSRNTVVNNILAYNPDYVFLMDTDIFPMKLVGGAWELFYDVVNFMVEQYGRHDVVGVYHYSKRGHPNVYRFTKKKKFMDFEYWEYEPVQLELGSGLHRVDAMGLGLVMFKPEVFVKVQYPWFRIVHLYDPEKRESFTMGEDLYFFNKAREAGVQVYVTTDVLALHESEAYLWVDGRAFLVNPFVRIS